MSDESMDEMEMDPEMQTIIFTCEEILSNIELDINIQLFEDLYHEHIYIEMFKKMFPFTQAKISQIEKSIGSTGDKLQQLINFLSSDILIMDLTHIKGQAIADRDSRPLINFLQILLELSKLYVSKTYSRSIPVDDQQQQQVKDEEEDNDGEPDEEGIYREEEEEDYNQHNSQVNQQQRLSKKQSQQNLIQDDNKQTFNPKGPSYPQQLNEVEDQDQNNDYEEDYAQQTLSEEQRMDTEKIQELFSQFKAGLIVEDDPRLEELHFLLSKYGLNLEDILQQEFFNQNQQQNGENGDTGLAHVIKVQSRQQKGKNQKSTGENSNKNVYGKQKNYQQFLKDYKRDYDRKVKKSKENNSRSGNRTPGDQHSTRLIQNEDKILRKEFQGEQQNLYSQMRDKKVQYLRNIHKIIFELEKKKIIDEQNDYNEKQRLKEEEAKNRLISIEDKYKNRIYMLQKGLQEKRRERKNAEMAQQQELTRQERELKDRKRRQIEDLKVLWKQERENFDSITKDDRILENQILELYKKY